MVATWWLLAGAAGGATVPVMSITRRLGALISAAAVSATALVGAPPASAAPGDDAAVVNSWYTDFLDRPAYGDPGAQVWVDRLGVQAPGDVVWAITHSREYNAARLDETYLYTLGRTASSDPGAAYWVRGVGEQRFPLEWVVQNVYASGEYTRGVPREQLVGNWYAGVFTYDITSFGEDNDRYPSDGEVAYWSARIAAVGTLGAYRELYYAPEAVAHRVTDHYLDLLGRVPSAGEIAYWSPKEVESDINVQVLIAATGEYRSLAR